MKEINKEILARIPMPRRVMAPFFSFGGKGNIVNRILQYMPPPTGKTKTYCEPFCRAASVFWNMPGKFDTEVLNDIDWRVINLFQVIRDTAKFEELFHRLIWTPYSYSEFKRAREVLLSGDCDDVELAWAFFVATNQGFSGAYERNGCWGRNFTTRCGMASICNSWVKRRKMLPYYHDRLQNVQIICRDALEVIPEVDSPGTLFYCDPPYVHSTRKGREYDFEMTDAQHHRLVETLIKCTGMVILSGYENEIYSKLEENNWAVVKFETVAYSAGATRLSGLIGRGARTNKVKRTELLWINPAAMNAITKL